MPNSSGAKVIVTGAIQSGKSTVVRAAMAQLGWSGPAGFFTHWGEGVRPAPAIFIEPWSGGAVVMARQLPDRTGPDGLPYALDEKSFTPSALASLRQAKGPVVIDELGVLELEADDFCAALANLFRGPSPVLAVIQERALARWLDRLGPVPAHTRVTVTPANRETLPSELVRLFCG